jgi:polyphosphate kinase 2 (PPK2 family)
VARKDSKKTDAAIAKPAKIKNKEFDEQLAKLQAELVKLQLYVQHKGLRVVVILTERVSPRVFRVVALPAPTEREKSQLYLQRYVHHLPAAGESSSSIAAGTTVRASKG